jgi:hypothetical protein
MSEQLSKSKVLIALMKLPPVITRGMAVRRIIKLAEQEECEE